METLLLLAAKSLIVAGGALLLLQLLRKRSAADRSWIAHLALGALLLLPIAAFALPSLDVQGPAFLVGAAEELAPATTAAPGPAPAPTASAGDASLAATGAADASAGSFQAPAVAGSPVDWSVWGYVLPAAVLILLTLIALGRLFILKSRARVLVEPEWLTALARAQHRMGFKHGTALLTSDELPSPISWGVIRPVILLNTEAAKSHAEAEAIITHELAHVARLDWAKLMLSRIAVALFWFNPLVWLLAREAHQLREEAADDSVLAADIDDTDYARLLVGVARHECRGLLIGAHGVAPGKNSLARRIKRVLDGAARRAPGGWRWGSAVAFFAAGMAVPVAALNLVPVAPASAADEALRPMSAAEAPYYAAAPVAAEIPLPPELASTVAAAAAAIGSQSGVDMKAGGSTITTTPSGELVLRSPNGSVVKVASADSSGRRRVVLSSSDGSTMTIADARAVPGLAAVIAHPHPPVPPAPPPLPSRKMSAIDRAIAAKAVGATPEYIAAMEAAVPHLGLDSDEIVGMRAVGVTPEFVRELARLGYRHLDADDITGAYAVGVRTDYVRSLAGAGYGRLSLEDLTELRAVGVTARDIENFRKAGYRNLDVDKLVELKALGITPEELKASEEHGP